MDFFTGPKKPEVKHEKIVIFWVEVTNFKWLFIFKFISRKQILLMEPFESYDLEVKNLLEPKFFNIY